MSTGHFASYSEETHRARLIGSLRLCCQEIGLTSPTIAAMNETELTQHLLALQAQAWLVGTLDPQRVLGGIAGLIDN